MAMPIPKKKKIRLNKKDVWELQQKIWERDGGRCVLCNRYVPIEEKFHHVKHGADKTDSEINGVILCQDCHYQIHHGLHGEGLNDKCADYLRDIYGEKFDEI